MFDIRLRAQEHTVAMAMLRKDHQTVKGLFERFEKAKTRAEKKNIAEAAIKELKIHAAVEEQIFYPAVRREILDTDGIMDKADEEHHEAKVLIAELELMSGSEENYDAKFKVLAENVRHHIKEEEREMFPKAAKTAIDFKTLGERMRQLKERLRETGVPEDPETAMVNSAGLRGESPSRKALKTIDVPMGEHAKRRHGRR